MENTEHMENRRTVEYNLVGLYLKVYAGLGTVENTEHREYRRTVEYNLVVGLHLKFVLENGGEHRAHREQENMEYYLVGLITFESLCWRTVENTEHRENRRTVEYNLVGLHLKFVLENGGEYRAHREQENMEYYLVGLHLKFMLENGGEYRAHREQENGGIQSNWVTFEVCVGERWRIQSS